MDKVAMTDFPSIAFQSSLGSEAILFGVFGFLYSVFGMYSSLVTPANPQRPPIVNKLRLVCRVITVLITVNALLNLYSLYSLNILGLGAENIILGAGFALTMLAIAGISIAWAFWYMD